MKRSIEMCGSGRVYVHSECKTVEIPVEIPEVLLRYIFSFLKDSELAACHRTNGYWNKSVISYVTRELKPVSCFIKTLGQEFCNHSLASKLHVIAEKVNSNSPRLHATKCTVKEQVLDVLKDFDGKILLADKIKNIDLPPLFENLPQLVPNH